MSVIQNRFSSNQCQDNYNYYLQHKNGFTNSVSEFDNNNSRSDVFYPTQDNCTSRSEVRPTFLFWTLVVFLFLLAAANLILTFIILGVLRLGQGMESIEFVSDENLIKLYGTADLDSILKMDGHIESFGDIPMEVAGDSDSVLILLSNQGAVTPSIAIGPENQKLKVDSFEVTDPISNIPIFTTEYPNFGLPRGVAKLDVQRAQTKRVASSVDGNLSFRSETIIKLKGSEGTRMEGKEVIWTADQEIFLKSVNKSIVLSGNDGIFIDLKRIPIAYSGEEARTKSQFKMCVCMPSGKLYMVPTSNEKDPSINCLVSHIPPSEHPCT